MDALIKELIEREDIIKPDENLSVQQKNDKDKAEDIRKKAMESMEKQKSENHRGERLMMISQQPQAARDVQSRQWISCAKMLTLKRNFASKSWRLNERNRKHSKKRCNHDVKTATDESGFQISCQKIGSRGLHVATLDINNWLNFSF